MSEKKFKLTARQKAFCDYYLKLGNATEACRKAGYKAKRLNVTAAENLAKPSVKQYLSERVAKMDKKRIADADEVLEFYTRIVRGQEKDQFDLDPSLETRIKASENLLKRVAKSRENELRVKVLELEVQKKQAEIDRLKGNRDSKTETVLDKLERILGADEDDE